MRFDHPGAVAGSLAWLRQVHYFDCRVGPTEHRGLLEATARYPLVRGVLLSDRNRLDLRSIDGEFAWRYRNRISAERTDSIRSYHFSAYLRAEAYYDGNFHKWSRTAESLGCMFPFPQAVRDRTRLRTSERNRHFPESTGQCIGPAA